MTTPKRVFAVSILGFSLLFPANAGAQDALRIDGSSGVKPLAKALGEAFVESPGGMAVEVGDGLGTKARLMALDEGQIDIATASHGADPTALAERGMTVYTIARIAVVFGVNAGIAINNLSGEQICDIYSGKVTNWRTFGGSDLAIQPRTRPDKEVDAAIVREGIRCLANLDMAASIKVNKKSGQMAKDLAATAGAIGMTTTTRVRRSKGKVRALDYDGIAPTVVNVEAGTYPFTREAYLVTKADPSAKVRAFLGYVKSAEGGEILRANDAIPVK